MMLTSLAPLASIQTIGEIKYIFNVIYIVNKETKIWKKSPTLFWRYLVISKYCGWCFQILWLSHNIRTLPYYEVSRPEPRDLQVTHIMCLCTTRSKTSLIRNRFCKILWPSQNIWTLFMCITVDPSFTLKKRSNNAKWFFDICNAEIAVLAKLDLIFINKVNLKLKCSKNVFYKKCGPRFIFFNDIFF